MITVLLCLRRCEFPDFVFHRGMRNKAATPLKNVRFGVSNSDRKSKSCCVAICEGKSPVSPWMDPRPGTCDVQPGCPVRAGAVVVQQTMLRLGQDRVKTRLIQVKHSSTSNNSVHAMQLQ